MRAIALVTVAMSFALPVGASALEAPTLSMGQAFRYSRSDARYLIGGFTETPPTIEAACSRVARNVAVCRLRVKGDRATIRYVARVTRKPGRVEVKSSDLQTYSGTTR